MACEIGNNDKLLKFNTLCNNVSTCRECERMNDSSRILSHSSGTVHAKIMFIAEAPGRLGADISSIPLHGDKTGNNFEALLEFANINRTDIFVTNAVLCNPKDENGNNDTPTKYEVIKCAKFLKEQIDIIRPQIIVTLGAVALYSLNLIESHNLTLKNSVRTTSKWREFILIPLYHPGQRAMLHRSFANQRSDYQFVKDELKKLDKRRSVSNNSRIYNPNIISIVSYILRQKSLSYFALHKLFYLLEYQWVIKYGDRLTTAFIIRQKDGPYCTDLHLNKLKNSIPDLIISSRGKSSFYLSLQSDSLFNNFLSGNDPELPIQVMEMIEEVLVKHGEKSNVALKKSAYFSRPMRNMLKIESSLGVNLYNSPISFENLVEV